MRFLAFLLGLALIAGEIARRGDSVLVQAKAVDDLAAGAVLLLLGLMGARVRPAFQAAGWALFTGVMISTLGVNLDGFLADTGKPRAGLYTSVLAVLVFAGFLASLWWATRRDQPPALSTRRRRRML